ncbi:MAG: hypothetical protein M3Y77_17280 [Actinomycetota bacterium]|nr:hypothetical protein [Actinomycetota bacterium]
MATPGDTENPREPSDDDRVEPPSSSANAESRHSQDEVLPRRSSDERDVGWGDSSPEYDDDWYLAERPPHHG